MFPEGLPPYPEWWPDLGAERLPDGIAATRRPRPG
jgi:hypothetical protein